MGEETPTPPPVAATVAIAPWKDGRNTCPICGQPYQDSKAFGRHLRGKHGMTGNEIDAGFDRGRPRQAPPGRVWEAYRATSPVDCAFYGFLVSEADDPHRPIALVLTFTEASRSHKDKPYDKVEAFRVAHRVAERPASLDEEEPSDCFVRDLRPFCRTDSLMPFPAELLSLRIGYLEGGAFDTFPFTPFCRFRFARLVDALVRMTWTEEQREKMPEVTIEINERDGGDSLYYTVAIPLSDIPL